MSRQPFGRLENIVMDDGSRLHIWSNGGVLEFELREDDRAENLIQSQFSARSFFRIRQFRCGRRPPYFHRKHKTGGKESSAGTQRIQRLVLVQ